MHGFLLKAYKPWSALAGGALDHFEGPYVDNQLDTPGKCCIGFDYQPVTGAEREYHWALVRWIAISVGKRRSKFRGDSLDLPSPVPYILFDGFESAPVLLREEWPDVEPGLQLYVCDPFGMRVDAALAQELAWYCLPDGAFERVTATHHGRSPDSVSRALIQEGLQGAEELIHGIRQQIGELDTLWKGR